jgi:hypothetical protein
MGWLDRFWPGNQAADQANAQQNPVPPAPAPALNQDQNITPPPHGTNPAPANVGRVPAANDQPVHGESAAPPPPPQIQVRPSIFQEVETFFVHLFSSLMPGSDPRDVAAARNQ